MGENFRKGLDNGYYGRTTDNDIAKHSFNIIDLIEVGDYVNGYKVLEIEDISNCNKKAYTIFEKNEHCYVRLWKTEDIKNIVTHEQFKSVMYEV